MLLVVKDGEEVKMSKRAGTYVTLRDLVDWVGRDAARFFLVSRKSDAEFVFDVNLACSKSDENPVYYLQYAHARICSVLRQAQERDLLFRPKLKHPRQISPALQTLPQRLWLPSSPDTEKPCVSLRAISRLTLCAYTSRNWPQTSMPSTTPNVFWSTMRLSATRAWHFAWPLAACWQMALKFSA